jgi:hypothetical protein
MIAPTKEGIASLICQGINPFQGFDPFDLLVAAVLSVLFLVVVWRLFGGGCLLHCPALKQRAIFCSFRLFS